MLFTDFIPQLQQGKHTSDSAGKNESNAKRDLPMTDADGSFIESVDENQNNYRNQILNPEKSNAEMKK